MVLRQLNLKKAFLRDCLEGNHFHQMNRIFKNVMVMDDKNMYRRQMVVA